MYVGGNTRPNMNPDERRRREQIALYVLDRLLLRSWKTTTDFGLPAVDPLIVREYQNGDEDYDFFFGGNFDDDNRPDLTDTSAANGQSAGIVPMNLDPAQYRTDPLYQGLNAEQQTVIDRAFEAFMTNASNSAVPRLILMTGCGGTGKTHVYKTLVALCRKYEIMALVTATTGVAATLLPMGTTMHSALSLPITNLRSDMSANIPLQGILCRRIKKAQLLIIDEVSMMDKVMLNIIDNTLRGILPVTDERKKIPFGGKVLLLGGDFQQLLPVVEGGGLLEQARASIRFSDLIHLFITLKLTQNMRVFPNQQQFTDLLKQVGTDADRSGRFNIPPGMRSRTLEDLIDHIYDNGNVLNNPAQITACLLLAPYRRDVDELNDIILRRLRSYLPYRAYFSIDTEINVSPLNVHAVQHDVQALHRETPSGMPPHELRLKEGAVVVLLRNIDTFRGLSNGTRMAIDKLHDTYLECTIIAGPYKGTQVEINKWKLRFEDKRLNGTRLHFVREQFPIQLAFAMTINKAQGQTCERIGIYLRQDVFSHGQLYVALSRVRSGDTVRIYVLGSECKFDNNEDIIIDNIVVHSVLDKDDT